MMELVTANAVSPVIDDASRPRVRGRHRNSALAAWRRTRAVELATQGLTYQQIADELGYAHRGTVHRIVQQALESRLTEGVEQLRQVEVARLDALQAGLWESALAGDAAAVNACVKIVQTRSRILGLFERPGLLGRDTEARCGYGRTVVLPQR